MRVLSIPCLADNYAYALLCDDSGEMALVDVSEASPVLTAVKREREASGHSLRVVAILATHHHHDHVGGNQEVQAALGIDRIYGSSYDRGRIPGQTDFLEEGATLHVGKIAVRVLHIPGHTLGALAYVATEGAHDPVVFTGDTLFVGGCGRLFEGTPAMMHRSLTKIASLPPATRVYCGHEYTESNLRFAAHVEPSNEAVGEAATRVRRRLSEGSPSVPSTVGEERNYNPFLRTDSAEIRSHLGMAPGASADETFEHLRNAKDVFR